MVKHSQAVSKKTIVVLEFITTMRTGERPRIMDQKQKERKRRRNKARGLDEERLEDEIENEKENIEERGEESGEGKEVREG